MGPAVSNVLEDLKTALETHQYSTPLQTQLPEIVRQATELLVDVPLPPGPTPPATESDSKAISGTEDLDELARELRGELEKKPGTTIDVTWRVRGGGAE